MIHTKYNPFYFYSHPQRDYFNSVRNTGLVLLGLLFLLSFSSTLQPALANSSKSSTNWIIVPVFFATNRVSAAETGPIDYLQESNEKGLQFGVKNIACPMPVNTPLSDDTQGRMLWQQIQLTPNDAKKDAKNLQRLQQQIEIYTKESTIKDKRLQHDEIVPAFASYMKQTDSKESVLFVHGCCVNFDTAMERAAMLSAHMQTPVLLYDWVSPMGFRNYLQNGTRAEQTMDSFCKFLANVEKITDPRHVILLGHSMGNHFVDESMLRRFTKNDGKPSEAPFKEIIMANADVDAQTFLNHASEVAANADITRIYVSNKDGRMNTSAFVHGGFRRLGSPGDLITKFSGIDRLEIIDTTAANSGHELLYWLVANMHKDNNVGPVKDFALKQLAPGHLELVNTALSKQDTSKTSVKPSVTQ